MTVAEDPDERLKFRQPRATADPHAALAYPRLRRTISASLHTGHRYAIGSPGRI